MLDTSQNSELPPARNFDINNVNNNNSDILPPVSHNNINNNNNNNNLPNVKKQPKRNFNQPKGNNINKEHFEEKYEVIEFMKPNGFFVFQTMLEFHYIFTLLYFFANVALFVYKNRYFYYPPNSISTEIAGLIFYFFVQLVRFYLGDLGNRTENSMFLLFNLIFALGPIYTYVQFLCLQTYCLRIDIIINSVGLFMVVAEIIPCILSFLAISKQESQI